MSAGSGFVYFGVFDCTNYAIDFESSSLCVTYELNAGE